MNNISSHRRIQSLISHLALENTIEANILSSVDTHGTSYQYIITEVQGRVGIITLNRPKNLNALNDGLIADITKILKQWRNDESIGCVVITGSGRAFAAGADITEMVDKSFCDMTAHPKTEAWEVVAEFPLPIIAAVNGYALGGGCEIAMMADIIYASKKAKFGQPEIKLGILPGAGGTQRLSRSIGKSKAMELVLSGRMMSATEAESAGLVSKVLEPSLLMPEVMKLAKEISELSRPAITLAKSAVIASFNTTLDQGNKIEKKLFASTFALADQKEGMNAFVSKRKANFQHK